MSKLNSKWETFRLSIELGASAMTLIGTGVWSISAATAERGYSAAGSEGLLAIAAAVFVGIVTHRIMNKAEEKLNEKLEKEERRQKAIEKACKARMYTICEPHKKRRKGCGMYSVGD